MSTHRNNNPRRTSVRRGLSSWGLLFVAAAVVASSLTGPFLLRGVGLGPVTATSICMVTLALLISGRSSVLDQTPTRLDVSVLKADPMLVAAVVLACGGLWWTAVIAARLLITDSPTVAPSDPVEPYLLTVLFVLLIAPVTEEVLYRGLLQGALRRVSPVVVSILLTTTVFAAVHPRPRDAVLAVAIGLLAGVTREMFGTMTAPILVHIAMNTASALVPAAAVSGLAHGPAAVPLLVLLAVSLLLLGIVARRRHAKARRSVSPTMPGGPEGRDEPNSHSAQ